MITDLLCIENVIYLKNTFHVDDKYSKCVLKDYIPNFQMVSSSKINSLLDKYDETIENMFVMNTFHSCYSHALMDCLFAYYWVLSDLNILQNVKCFITKSKITKFPNQNKKHIDETKIPIRYIGVYHDFIKMITNEEYIFEHMNTKSFLIKKCFFYPYDDRWQRSIWNCLENFCSHRSSVSLNNTIFSDKVIYDYLDKFVDHVFNNLGVVRIQELTPRNCIIIERKYDRQWDESKRRKIIDLVKSFPSINYNGIHILEDYTFKEQLKLFNNNNIFIFRHGSAVVNLLWIPKKSLVFDIDINDTYKVIVPRLLKLTNSSTCRLEYHSIDYEKILMILSSYLN